VGPPQTLQRLPGVVRLTKKPRHILFITDSFHPATGGVERVCLCLGEALVKLGLRVTVLTRAVPTAPPQEMILGMHIIRYRVGMRFTPYIYLTHAISSLFKTWRLLQNDKPDLIHMHLALASQGPLSAAAGKEIPIVASFYGPWHKEFLAESQEMMSERGPIFKSYLKAQMAAQKLMQKRMLRRADRIVVLSDFSRGEAEKIAPGSESKIVKIPGGIDPTLFKLKVPGGIKEKYGFPKNAPLLVTVRRLVKRMGVDMLIGALALVRERGSQAHLLIAGKGPERKALEQMAAENNLSEQVRFIGFVSDKDLPNIYQGADLMVVPTRSQENFGLPILEAAACGLPVAATPVGSIPELMQIVSSPFISSRTDAVSLAETIEEALGKLQEFKLMMREQTAPKIAAQYSWDAVTKMHLENYRNIFIPKK